MTIHYYGLDADKVINGYVVMASTTYETALSVFVPLIGRLDMQRDVLNTKFYSRLQQDIVQGCVMPPISIALIEPAFAAKPPTQKAVHTYIQEHIAEGFVLDGIQRLSTLSRAAEDPKFDDKRNIHVNFIIADSRDRLLYRMITLNNGQKPMSARHQIDILADTFFDFDNVLLRLVAEKGGGRVRAPDTFKKADFVKGYIAYLSDSVNIDNQKIIEQKMDELIATRIIESDIPTSKVEFADVIELVLRFAGSDQLGEWIRNQNNFIGFCVGARRSSATLSAASTATIERAVSNFERAFSSFNVSKINVGKVRRELVAYFIENFSKLKSLDELSLLDKLSDRISA